MKSIFKKGLVVLLAALTLVLSVFVYSERTEAAMTYNNTNSTNLIVSINSGGRLDAALSVMGINGKTTRIETALYVEKRVLGIFWRRVDIGCTDNVWHDSVTTYYYYHTFTHDLSATGTYRVTVTYTVSGSGGADDVITLKETATY